MLTKAAKLTKVFSIGDCGDVAEDAWLASRSLKQPSWLTWKLHIAFLNLIGRAADRMKVLFPDKRRENE